MELQFSEMFLRIRQDRGFTQKQMAEKLGVTSQAISKWETGSSLPDLGMVKSIAILLDCSIDYLMGHAVTERSRINLQSLERRMEIERAISKEQIEVQVGAGLIPMLLEEQKNDFDLIHQLRVRLADKYGIYVPAINLKDQISLEEYEYKIILFGRKETANGILKYPMKWYAASKENHNENDRITYEMIRSSKEIWSDKEIEGCQSFTAMQILTYHLENVILDQYDKILNKQIIAEMVKIVHKKYPVITEGVVPEKISYLFLQKIVSSLIRERYSVNRLDYIIAYLEEAIPYEKNIDKLIEEIKENL